MTLRVAAAQLTTLAAVRDSDCSCITADDPSDEDLGLLIDAASDVIALVSGGKVAGRSEATVLPCRDDFDCWCGCGCGLDGIPLPGPDPHVTDVFINDVELATDSYAIHHDRSGGPYLVRVASGARPPSWPRSQSLWRQGTGDNTFRFTVEWGVHVDWIVTEAANELVCEFSLNPATRRRNAAPRGATTVAQGGVTVSIDEMVARMKAGEAGPAMTRLLGVYAPGGMAPSVVWSPELSGGWTLHTIAAPAPTP